METKLKSSSISHYLLFRISINLSLATHVTSWSSTSNQISRNTRAEPYNSSPVALEFGYNELTLTHLNPSFSLFRSLDPFLQSSGSTSIMGRCLLGGLPLGATTYLFVAVFHHLWHL